MNRSHASTTAAPPHRQRGRHEQQRNQRVRLLLRHPQAPVRRARRARTLVERHRTHVPHHRRRILHYGLRPRPHGLSHHRPRLLLGGAHCWWMDVHPRLPPATRDQQGAVTDGGGPAHDHCRRRSRAVGPRRRGRGLGVPLLHFGNPGGSSHGPGPTGPAGAVVAHAQHRPGDPRRCGNHGAGIGGTSVGCTDCRRRGTGSHGRHGDCGAVVVGHVCDHGRIHPGRGFPW